MIVSAEPIEMLISGVRCDCPLSKTRVHSQGCHVGWVIHVIHSAQIHVAHAEELAMGPAMRQRREDKKYC